MVYGCDFNVMWFPSKRIGGSPIIGAMWELVWFFGRKYRWGYVCIVFWSFLIQNEGLLGLLGPYVGLDSLCLATSLFCFIWVHLSKSDPLPLVQFKWAPPPLFFLFSFFFPWLVFSSFFFFISFSLSFFFFHHNRDWDSFFDVDIAYYFVYLNKMK